MHLFDKYTIQKSSKLWEFILILTFQGILDQKMGKRPTVVLLSEEEQKLVSEVLNRIFIRKRYRGQDHCQNLHQNEAIVVRSEAKSLL